MTNKMKSKTQLKERKTNVKTQITLNNMQNKAKTKTIKTQ